MNLSEELNHINTIFIDTAPVIYFIEALVKKFAELLKHGRNLTLFEALIVFLLNCLHVLYCETKVQQQDYLIQSLK